MDRGPRGGRHAVGVRRRAQFARTDRRGGCVPVVQHPGVGFLLADVKTRIEAVRALTPQRACAALDSGSPGAEELSVHAKVFGSETAVQSLFDLMRVVDVDSYGHHLPLAGPALRPWRRRLRPPRASDAIFLAGMDAIRYRH
ncbi:MAG: hypothetical protein J0I49_32080 [Pseudonocardia sp.]|nr:hypothetical protein [Pseudonocardia sp.]